MSDVYQSMVTNGTLQPDNHQLEVVTRLQLLQKELEGHLPAGNGTRPSWIHKVLPTQSCLFQSKIILTRYLVERMLADLK